MNADSRAIADIDNHFGRSGSQRRILAVGVEQCSDDNRFRFVKVDNAAVGDHFGHDGDCWLIDAGKADASWLEIVQRSGLPVVVVAVDGISAPAASALIDAADGHVLPGDSAATVAAVLARAMARDTGLRVADLSDGAARTMQALSIDASRIAERLATLAASQAVTAPAERGVDAVLVRRMIKLRRDRERFLPAEILADPAWDILLDLTAARLEGKAVPVSSLCIAAAVPTTTALRWIRSLTEAGLVQRRLDNHDARRSHIELADSAAATMLAYLRSFNAAFALR